MEPNSSVAEAHAVAHSVEHAEGAEGDEGTEVPRGPAVRAHIGHMQFEVPIGDGQQSMKWLSMTIVMRHHALSDARAAPRQRERKGRMPGIFLPSAIHGGEHMREDGSGAATHGRHFCNPNPKLAVAKVLCPGDHVFVELGNCDAMLERMYGPQAKFGIIVEGDRAFCGGWGVASAACGTRRNASFSNRVSEWAFEAFSNPNVKCMMEVPEPVAHRDASEHEEVEEDAAAAPGDTDEEIEHEQGATVVSARSFRVAEIVHNVFDVDEDKVTTHLHHDWVVGRMSKFVKPADEAALLELLRSRYGIIELLIAAAGGLGCEAKDLGYDELLQILWLGRMYDERAVTPALVENLFKNSMARIGAADDAGEAAAAPRLRSLKRAHVVLLLVRLAAKKFESDQVPLVAAVELAFERHVTPVLDHLMQESDEFAHVWLSAEVREVLNLHCEPVRAIFQALDDERHKVKRAPAALLTYFEYLQWLEDAGLLSLVGRSIATSSFACSVLANRDGAVRVSEEQLATQRLVYVQFLQAVCRLVAEWCRRSPARRFLDTLGEALASLCSCVSE